MAASRAIDCATYAIVSSDNDNRVSYDDILTTMMQTGLDMNSAYRETAQGGLAKFFKERFLGRK
jgi:L-serine dehydratase